MILKLEHINKAYHTGKLDVPVLHDVSLHVEKGEYVAIRDLPAAENQPS